MKWVEGTSYKTEEGWRQAALTVTSELFTRPLMQRKQKKGHESGPQQRGTALMFPKPCGPQRGALCKQAVCAFKGNVKIREGSTVPD